MPDLSKKYFSSEKDITAEKGRELVTKGDSEDIIRTLTKLGWEGQLIAAVMIRVSVDGRRAEDGQFSLRGALASEPIRIQAAKLWEKADEDVTLEIDVPPGDRFDFQGGRLYSDYLDQDKVRHKLTKEGRILTEAERKKHGLGDFCLRALTHLSRSSNGSSGPAVKFTVLAHHMGADSLTELSEATQGPSWPGIKILEGQCQLFPVQSQLVRDNPSGRSAAVRDSEHHEDRRQADRLCEHRRPPEVHQQDAAERGRSSAQRADYHLASGSHTWRGDR